jgi:hypothetical protein
VRDPPDAARREPRAASPETIGVRPRAGALGVLGPACHLARRVPERSGSAAHPYALAPVLNE